MSSADIPHEVMPASSHDTGLHSFTKLAIAYTAIGLGLYILFLGSGTFSIISFTGLSNYPAALYGLLFGLPIMMILAIHFLRKGRRMGAYLFFASIGLYHLQYVPYPEFLIISLIPTGVVAGLLLASYKHLQ